MKKNIILKVLVALVVVISLFASAVPASAAVSNPRPSDDTLTEVSGVVRAIMATSAGDTGSPLQEMVLDTGREMISLEEHQYENLNPGALTSIPVELSDVEQVSFKAQVAPLAKTYSPIPDRRLLIVPVQWAGSSFSAARMATLNATIPALKTWWSSVSLGIETLTVNTLPVQDIAVDTTCDYLELGRAALVIAQKFGVTSWFTNISLVLPDENECWWGGLGMMPGEMTWMNSIDVGVFAHELGHNMGLAHANGCIGSTTVSLIQKCKHNEYGDPTDVMGHGGEEFGYNAAYLRQLGWISDTKIQTWTGGSVNVTLSALRNASGATRAVRIPMVTTFGEQGPGEYWIQFRNENSFWPRSGVYMNLIPTTAHIANAASNVSSTNSWGLGLFTWLCDLTPNAEMDGDFEFVMGKKWNDPLGRFSITVTAVSATSATVNISPSTVLPVGTQSVSAIPEVDADGKVTGNIRVNWDVVAPAAYSQTEPAQWIATTLDGQSCVASVAVRTCLISGVPRLVPIRVGVVGKNYAGVSSPRSFQLQPLPLSAPSLVIKAEATSSDAIVALTSPDNGGSPISSLSVTVDNKPCVLSGMTCSVAGLYPNSEYTVVAIAQNAIGSRRAEINFKTSLRIPKSPFVSIVKNGDHFEMRAGVEDDEVNNVSRLEVYCGDVQSSWMKFDAVRDGVVVALPAVPNAFRDFASSGASSRSTRMGCHVQASNEIGRSASTYKETPLITIRKSPAGITTGPSSASDQTADPSSASDQTADTYESRFKSDFRVSVKKTAAKTYVVSWKSTGIFTTGPKTRVVVPKIKGRPCVRRTSTSCVFRGLNISKPTKLVVKVYKQSSSEQFYGTKTVKVRP
jgi:hypothetical protein